jgi:hypothetical protein
VSSLTGLSPKLAPRTSGRHLLCRRPQEREYGEDAPVGRLIVAATSSTTRGVTSMLSFRRLPRMMGGDFILVPFEGELDVDRARASGPAAAGARYARSIHDAVREGERLRGSSQKD